MLPERSANGEWAIHILLATLPVKDSVTPIGISICGMHIISTRNFFIGTERRFTSRGISFTPLRMEVDDYGEFAEN